MICAISCIAIGLVAGWTWQPEWGAKLGFTIREWVRAL